MDRVGVVGHAITDRAEADRTSIAGNRGGRGRADNSGSALVPTALTAFTTKEQEVPLVRPLTVKAFAVPTLTAVP